MVLICELELKEDSSRMLIIPIISVVSASKPTVTEINTITISLESMEYECKRSESTAPIVSLIRLIPIGIVVYARLTACHQSYMVGAVRGTHRITLPALQTTNTHPDAEIDRYDP